MCRSRRTGDLRLGTSVVGLSTLLGGPVLTDKAHCLDCSHTWSALQLCVSRSTLTGCGPESLRKGRLVVTDALHGNQPAKCLAIKEDGHEMTLTQFAGNNSWKDTLQLPPREPFMCEAGNRKSATVYEVNLLANMGLSVSYKSAQRNPHLVAVYNVVAEMMLGGEESGPAWAVGPADLVSEASLASKLGVNASCVLRVNLCSSKFEHGSAFVRPANAARAKARKAG